MDLEQDHHLTSILIAVKWEILEPHNQFVAFFIPLASQYPPREAAGGDIWNRPILHSHCDQDKLVGYLRAASVMMTVQVTFKKNNCLIDSPTFSEKITGP